MATTSPNLGLSLPEASENISRIEYVTNLSLIDTAMGGSGEITPTIDNTVVSSGSVTCEVRNGIAFVHLENLVFSSSGTKNNVITGLPKSAIKVNKGFTSNNAANSASLNAGGDLFYIAEGGTSITMILSSSAYSLRHYANICYPVDYN